MADIEDSGPEAKKPKLVENGSNEIENDPDKQEELKDFSGFKISRILSESSERKSIVVEGTFDHGRRSVVALERLPIRQEILQKILSVRKLPASFHSGYLIPCFCVS